MADAAEAATFEDAASAVSQGKRHLLVRDYGMAVAALAEGCRMLAEQHGDTSDELGEPFLLYGRALLCLSREEAGVLGAGVPGSEEAEDEPEADEAEAEAEEEEEDEEGDEEDEAAEKPQDAGEESKSTENKTEKPSAEEKSEKAEKTPTATNNSAPSADSSAPKSEEASGSGTKLTNGDASTSKAYQNGDAHEEGDEDAEDVDNEEDDDANSNLQLAWEILELAKLILLKRGETGWKLLAEAHRLLGEVAMESGNQAGALTDLNACLDLLRKIEPADPRSMAETHYQLGLAYSLGNEFDASIEQFNEATSLLETRIKDLQDLTETPKTDDPFYSVEGEIKELRELLPEIREKISDMRDFKQQACKLVIEGIKSRVAGGSCSNGAGTSGESSSSSSKAVIDAFKPVSDISHLVRKKRKADEEVEHKSPCKKTTPENIA